jgi:hypothetical protein
LVVEIKPVNSSAGSVLLANTGMVTSHNVRMTIHSNTTDMIPHSFGSPIYPIYSCFGSILIMY